jgi:hypothetical protein
MEKEIEIWKDIEGYEGYYQVSNFGRVKSLNVFGKEKHRKLQTDKNGYLVIGLRKLGKEKNCKVHRLVALTFIPNSNNKKTINHIDGVKTNNQVSNLEWATYSENMTHAFITGLKPNQSGSKNWQAKVSEKDVLEIRKKAERGAKQASLGREYNLSQPAISLIINKRNWKHI